MRSLPASVAAAASLLLLGLSSGAQAQSAGSTYCGSALTAAYSGYSGSGTGSATTSQTTNICGAAQSFGTQDADISLGLYPSASYNVSSFANNGAC